MSRVMLAALLSLALSTSAKGVAARDATFNWTTISPSKDLSWEPCYDGYQCAKLTLPLQYSNPDAGQASIAILMSPSSYSKGDPQYLGPLLFNPGGPGGAGTSYLMANEAYFRQVVGPQYDLVGFDPRGVGESTPPLSLFHDPAEAFEFYSAYPLNVNESASGFGQFYAQAQLLGLLAVDRYKEVAESVGTAAVATDMLQISRAFGFDEVNYWGVSYGSILGATFAAMFPNNVGRFIIDGVLNSHDWYQGNWSTSLLQTDAALQNVYTACVSVGPSNCALHEATPELVQARVERIFASVRLTPHIVYNNTDPTNTLFGTVDSSLLLLQLFQSLYEPAANAAPTFDALRALEKGDAQPIFMGSVKAANDELSTCQYDPSVPFVSGFLDTATPIACGDVADGSRVTTIEEAMEGYGEMADKSPFAATWYPLSEGRCAGWKIGAADKLNGSFVTATSTPILLISNTFDPVTPIIGGRNMSAGFEHSVLLEQNSTGHTSLSSPSTCTNQAIRTYLVNGTLPAKGTVCQPDTGLFLRNVTALELREEKVRVDMSEVWKGLRRG